MGGHKKKIQVEKLRKVISRLAHASLALDVCIALIILLSFLKLEIPISVTFTLPSH